MTKLRINTLLPILALPLLVNSCINCIEGNGTLSSEDRSDEIKTFTKVELHGSYDMEIIQDSFQTLVIEGDENIISHISTRVSGNRLIVETEDNHCINYDHPIKVKISVATIENIELYGSGSINCDSLSNTSLDLYIDGSGDIDLSKLTLDDINVFIEGSGSVDLSGTATISSFTIEGSGDIRAADLLQQKCKVKIDGSGSIYTNFTESLSGVINGSGSIYYIGPKANVDIDIHGSGDVISNN
jgi:hypothetical protein